MKLLKVSSQIFYRELDRNIQLTVSQVEETLSTSVAVVYRQLERGKQGEIKLRLQSYSEKELLYYILLNSYLSEDNQAIFQIELERIISKKIPIEDRELFLTFLSEPYYLKIYLLESSRFFKTTEEFFGWIRRTREVPEFFLAIKVDWKHIFNPINHSRVRGYRDKGSLGPQFVGDREWLIDWSNTEEELRREEIQQNASDATQIILGFIQ